MTHIASKMNSYLSDLVVFYAKLHDLHWNVKGVQFVPVHEYTESRYEDMASKLDEIAELIVMHGEKPVSTLSQYLSLAGIRELGRDSYRDQEVLKILKEDLTYLRDEAVKLRGEMAAEDVFDVVAVLEDHVAGYNKELWFLSSMLS